MAAPGHGAGRGKGAGASLGGRWHPRRLAGPLALPGEAAAMLARAAPPRPARRRPVPERTSGCARLDWDHMKISPVLVPVMGVGHNVGST
jgi:hypothetical protein